MPYEWCCNESEIARTKQMVWTIKMLLLLLLDQTAVWVFFSYIGKLQLCANEPRAFCSNSFSLRLRFMNDLHFGLIMIVTKHKISSCMFWSLWLLILWILLVKLKIEKHAIKSVYCVCIEQKQTMHGQVSIRLNFHRLHTENGEIHWICLDVQ